MMRRRRRVLMMMMMMMMKGRGAMRRTMRMRRGRGYW